MRAGRRIRVLGTCLADPGSSAGKGTAIQIASRSQIPGEQ